jgi:hypothetical protein
MVLEKLDLIARHFDRLQASTATGDPMSAAGDAATGSA